VQLDGWIDVHAHFYPPESEEKRLASLKAMQQACWCTKEAVRWDPDEILAYMDRRGVQMQLLSNITPDAKTLEDVRRVNDYAAGLVRQHPTRFGLLAFLPTDDPDGCLGEIRRAADELNTDGFAVVCRYNGVYLSDRMLDPVWAELDHRRATVFCHPSPNGPPTFGRPNTVIDVAFETAQTVTDMVYTGLFRRFPNIRFIVAHCGGAFPAVSGRLLTLGLENWVANPEGITPVEMRQHMRRLYLDTAATMPTGLAAALAMTSLDKIVYGSDCGVPCTTDATMDANLDALFNQTGLSAEQVRSIGHNALNLFPSVAGRLACDR
jgi:predicted TIM-barrel fold metal-dependent hydrolase